MEVKDGGETLLLPQLQQSPHDRMGDGERGLQILQCHLKPLSPGSRKIQPSTDCERATRIFVVLKKLPL